jgi:hypothetical protein
MGGQPGAATVSHNRHKWDHYVVGVAVALGIGLPGLSARQLPTCLPKLESSCSLKLSVTILEASCLHSIPFRQVLDGSPDVDGIQSTC